MDHRWDVVLNQQQIRCWMKLSFIRVTGYELQLDRNYVLAVKWKNMEPLVTLCICSNSWIFWLSTRKLKKKIKHCTHKVPVYECSEGSLPLTLDSSEEFWLLKLIEKYVKEAAQKPKLVNYVLKPNISSTILRVGTWRWEIVYGWRTGEEHASPAVTEVGHWNHCNRDANHRWQKLRSWGISHYQQCKSVALKGNHNTMSWSRPRLERWGKLQPPRLLSPSRLLSVWHKICPEENPL